MVTTESLDPRVARSRANILAAARDLLVEGGPSAVTVDAVVARSGVAKTTIYRHWPSQRELLVAVLRDCAPQFEDPPADADFETSLRHLVHAIAEMFLDKQWRRVLPAMLMLKSHLDDIDQLEEEMRNENLGATLVIIEKGIAEGRLRADTDPERVIRLLAGPLLMSILIDDDVPDGLADDVVDRFLISEAALLT